MKRDRWSYWMLIGFALLVFNACSDKPETGEKITTTAEEMTAKVKETSQKAKETAQEATSEMKATVAETTEWTKEKIDAYQNKIQTELGDFDTKFETLAEKAASLGEATKETFGTQLEILGAKKKEAAEQLETLKGASGDEWQAAKAKFDDLMAEIKMLYEKIQQELASS